MAGQPFISAVKFQKMRPANAQIAKIAVVLLIGIPGSLVFLPVCGFIIYSGWGTFHDALNGGPWHYSPNPTLEGGALYLLWGLAGFAGVGGFWLWVFREKWAQSVRFNTAVSMLLLAGILAMFPVFFAAWSPPFFFGILPLYTLLGLGTGMVLLYSSSMNAWENYSMQRKAKSRVIET
jgi:hypothetical protein